MLFIIKVMTNKEDKVIETIAERARKKQLQVYSLVRPHGLKGYVILEAVDRESAEEAAYNLQYVKGIIGKTITYEEVKNMLEPKIEEMNIEPGDIIEMIGQTFKGEKAKVIRIDKQKGEAVVSLLGASIPIPVTVKMDNVKVIRREKDDEESGEEESEDEESEDEEKKQITSIFGGLNES